MAYKKAEHYEEHNTDPLKDHYKSILKLLGEDVKREDAGGGGNFSES